MAGYRAQRWRVRMFEVIERDSNHDLYSRIYDGYMLVTIVISVLPLTSKNWTTTSIVVDWITSILFLIDYIMRWATADLLAKSHGQPSTGLRPFLRYPLTPMAIIDLLSILPTVTSVLPVVTAAGTLRVLRMTRAVRCMRVFKFVRYSDQFNRILRVFRQEQKVLYAVLGIALAYIFVCAITMFSLEPTNFHTFFDAIYWSASTLTTVGYGDVYPVTDYGRVLSMFAAVFGIAVVALPSGIITAAFLEDFQDNLNKQAQNDRISEEQFRQEVDAMAQEMEALEEEISGKPHS